MKGEVTMATKSFSTDFKITTRNADSIAKAISKSRKVEYKNNHKIENISDETKVNSFMKKVFNKQ